MPATLPAIAPPALMKLTPAFARRFGAHLFEQAGKP